MALHQNPQQHLRFHFPTWHRSASPAVAETSESVVTTTTAAYALAATRTLLGFVFLWAFFDKAFGWGYATPAARSWVNGGSPTKGFLSSVDVGPFQSTAHAIAGTWWANWLFMLGLLGIGISLTFGVAMRIGGAAACAMYVLMWAASFPLVNNPVIDDHVLGAISAVVLALTLAGDTWGFGRWWSRIELVRTYPALR